MKILALYDIHGNTDALDAVLGDSRAQAPDVVVVGGDAVPGPLTRQVLDRLDGFNVPVRWVRGNGEREVAAAAAGRSGGNDGLKWPHCDGLNWPHLPSDGRPTVRASSSSSGRRQREWDPGWSSSSRSDGTVIGRVSRFGGWRFVTVFIAGR